MMRRMAGGAMGCVMCHMVAGVMPAGRALVGCVMAGFGMAMAVMMAGPLARVPVGVGFGAMLGFGRGMVVMAAMARSPILSFSVLGFGVLVAMAMFVGGLAGRLVGVVIFRRGAMMVMPA